MYSAFPRRDENFVSSYLAVPVLVAGAAAFAEPSLLDKSETSGYFEKMVRSLLFARHAGFGQGSSYGTKNIANKFPLLVKEKLGLGTLIYRGIALVPRPYSSDRRCSSGSPNKMDLLWEL